MQRKSKSITRKIQDELWENCRRIAKARYADKDGKWHCYTCEKEIEKSNCQLGHFIPNSVGGALLRYNLDNLRLQCYYCNINLGGNGSAFYRQLLKDQGQEYIDNLFRLKQQSTKAIDHYIKTLEDYKKIDK